MNLSKSLNGSVISSARRLIRKRTAQVRRDIHGFRTIGVFGALSSSRPLLVHIVPMRRCNLACTYCNEFDNFSDAVPLETMKLRIDKLAEFGTCSIGISGGEPLMHPELDELIAYIRERGIFVGLLTNGYLLTEKRIKRLNTAGLETLQISIDNVMPDDVSKKSLKVLDQKLVLLQRFAEFGVNINSVIGSGTEQPGDAVVVARRATELGFTTTVGIIHNGKGQLKPLYERNERIYRQLKDIGRKNFGFLNGFEKNLVAGKSNDWSCRAGARYFYVDEDGLVHYCSQRRGFPAVPLDSYTTSDIDREYSTQKECASYCTVACVQRVSALDSWRRSPQTILPQPAVWPRLGRTTED